MMDSSSKRQRRKDARPREIIDAALKLFHSKGFSASKIEDVAHAAGVTKGTVYLYFSSKEELFKAAIRETVVPNIDKIEEAARTHSNATARLRSAMHQWITNLLHCRGSISKLIIAEAGNFPELAEFYQEEVSGKVRKTLSSIIELGVAQGEFAPCNIEIVSNILIAPILLANIWRHTFPVQAPQLMDALTLTDQHLHFVLNGIAKRTESAQ